jgi:hypothetical protein
MPPATSRSRPPRRPLTGMMWLGARLTLALRRTRRFVRWWLAVGGTLTIVALLLPVAVGNQNATLSEARVRTEADTVRTARALARAQQRAALADSTLAAALLAATERPSEARPVPTPSPRTSSLAQAIAAARLARETSAVLALAAHPALAGGPRMRATADSFRTAPNAAEASRLAGTIIAMAEYRLRALGEAPVPVVSAPERLVASVPRVDTASIAAIVRAENDTLRAATAAHAEAVRLFVDADQRVAAARAAVPLVSPGLAFIAVVLLGLIVRIGLALLRELREPRLAHPLEAERAVGAPALSLVRDSLPEGPLRFRPSGVDPFRVLYLHLTSTGTRTRAVIVTGDDGIIVAAVGARLAIAAAADHRTTLVADCDSELIALARIFRDHPEPGVSDAMAGAFTWREIARHVGSSDGLSIAMLPAGTTRPPASNETRDVALSEFQKFRAGFEFSIVAVTLRDLAEARALLPDAPVVVCATLGETRVDALVRGAAAAEDGADPVHSLVLWDAPQPILPSRAELAAWLSKRKGRTPGGSFKAVQEAIKKPL